LAGCEASKVLSIDVAIHAVDQTHLYRRLYESRWFPKRKRRDMCRLSRSKKLTDFVRGSYTFLHHLDDFSIYALVLYEIEIPASLDRFYLEMHKIY